MTVLEAMKQGMREEGISESRIESIALWATSTFPNHSLNRPVAVGREREVIEMLKTIKNACGAVMAEFVQKKTEQVVKNN